MTLNAFDVFKNTFCWNLTWKSRRNAFTDSICVTRIFQSLQQRCIDRFFLRILNAIVNFWMSSVGASTRDSGKVDFLSFLLSTCIFHTGQFVSPREIKVIFNTENRGIFTHQTKYWIDSCLLGYVTVKVLCHLEK